MRFGKLLWFDMKNGWLKVPIVFICPILFSFFCFLEVRRKNLIWEKTIGIGDYWLYLYGGMREYVPVQGNAFTFPTVWIGLFLFCSFMVLNYPLRDLHNIGTQILIRTKGRTFWWLSKCFWNFASTISYHGIVFLTLGIMCFIFHVPFIWQLNAEAVSCMFGLFLDEVPSGRIPFLVFWIPVILSVAINLFQMMLTLFFKPIFSYLFSCALFLTSSYLMSPIVLGNYGMVLRTKWINKQGVSPEVGIIICLAISGIAIIGGGIRFCNMDILNES